MSPALRVVLVVLAAAGLAALLFPVYLRVLAGDSKVFEAQSFDFALVAIGTFVIVVGLQVVPWRTATNVAVLGTLVGGGLLFGALAIFSVGVLVLPVAIVLLVVLARAIGRARLSVARPAALGGALIGYGLVLLFIALIIPPTVECLANGGGAPQASAGAKAAARTP